MQTSRSLCHVIQLYRDDIMINILLVKEIYNINYLIDHINYFKNKKYPCVYVHLINNLTHAAESRTQKLYMEVLL